ncbi:hypothetical protein [Lysinibacillus fusiformis]
MNFAFLIKNRHLSTTPNHVWMVNIVVEFEVQTLHQIVLLPMRNKIVFGDCYFCL